MSKRVNRPFCTIFKRTDSEKMVWGAAKELSAQKQEIEALKAELDALKADKETKPSRKKSSTKEE